MLPCSIHVLTQIYHFVSRGMLFSMGLRWILRMWLCIGVSTSFRWVKHVFEVFPLRWYLLLLDWNELLVIQSALAHHLALRHLRIYVGHHIHSFSFFELIYSTASYKTTFLIAGFIGIDSSIRSLWRYRFSPCFSDINSVFVANYGVTWGIFLRSSIWFTLRSLSCSLCPITHVELILTSGFLSLLLIILRT